MVLGVYRGLEHFRGDSRVSTWAYRIAVRSATRVRARQKKHAPFKDAPSAAPSEVPERDLRRALGTLPIIHATVLALFALDGPSHTEIAEVLNVPEGTIWSRLHAARKKLAEALGSSP